MATLETRIKAFLDAIGLDIKVLRGVSSQASTATLTPSAAYHQHQLTGQLLSLTIAAPTGSPADGQSMMFRIKDSGTARTIGWNAIYRAIGVTLPLTTVAGKTLYVGCKYNSADAKWDVLAVGQEA